MGSRRPDASQGSTPLNPTYYGHVNSTADAILLFESCLGGSRSHVPRRPHDRERAQLIRSGYVYIYEEHSSGIKRWTDGITWSPSRIMNNFLVYRELDTPFPPGEKKRATKKPKKANAAVKSEPGGESSLNGTYPHRTAQQTTAEMDLAEQTRLVYGSLIDSYDFKEGGLVKKTISITYRGVPHHLVSYYTAEDIISGRLPTPTSDAQLRWMVPRTELLISQNFRSPVEIGQLNLQGTVYPPPSAAQLEYGDGGGDGVPWDNGMAANPQSGYPQNPWRSMSMPGNSLQPPGGGYPYAIPQQLVPQQHQHPEHPTLQDAQQVYHHEYQQAVPHPGGWSQSQGSFPVVASPAGAEPHRRHSTAFPVVQGHYHPVMSYGGSPRGEARLSVPQNHPFGDGGNFLTAASTRMATQHEEAPPSPRTNPRVEDDGHVPGQFNLDMSVGHPYMNGSENGHSQHDQYDTGLHPQADMHGFSHWGSHPEGM
jgi:Gti1/Pac2 family transcription factor